MAASERRALNDGDIKPAKLHLPPERVKYFQSFQAFSEDDTSVPPRDLNSMACYAVGIVEDIASHKPDVAIACDRGGRLFGLAVYRMWSELMNEPFPTVDSKLHFAKLSAREVEYQDRREITEYRIRDRIDSALREGERKGRELPAERPNVLIIDDWVSSGETYELAASLSRKLDFGMRYGVMEADGYRRVIEGYREDMDGIHGRVELSLPINLGVDYDVAHRTETVPGSAQQVRRTRQELYKAVERVAKFVTVE